MASVVVVTGASYGVGWALANACARPGVLRSYGSRTALGTVIGHVAYGAIVGRFAASL